MNEQKCNGGVGFPWGKALMSVLVGGVITYGILILGTRMSNAPSITAGIKTIRKDVAAAIDPIPEDQIKTFEKTIIDGPTGYRFAHLTTVVLDGETGKITHMVTQMRLIPGPPVPQPKPTQKPEVNPNLKGGD